MKVFASPYHLIPKISLGAKLEKRERNGFLLRIYFDNKTTGYCDYCHEKIDLQESSLTPQFQQSLYFARLDATARKDQRSLFKELPQPKNHFLLTQAILPKLKELETYSTLKLKVQKSQRAQCLNVIESLARETSLKLRLDFNSSFSVPELKAFLFELSVGALDSIDFLEDPTPYNAKEWFNLKSEFHVKIALDQKEPNQKYESDSFDVLVIKSALEDPEPLVSRARQDLKRCVFTSYMDHPVGVAFARFRAARYLQSDPLLIDDCGLETNDLFEETPFHDHPKDGYGIGFDSLLRALTWTPIP